jgi:hypothetical protein
MGDEFRPILYLGEVSEGEAVKKRGNRSGREAMGRL